MIESLDDALDALIREVAGPLARNLGETIVGLEKSYAGKWVMTA